MNSISRDKLLGLDSGDINFETRLDQYKDSLPNFVFDYLKSIYSNILDHNGKDLNEILLLCEVLIDYAWEMLNTNIWVFVEDYWRILYAYAILYKIICIRIDDSGVNENKLIQLCDLGFKI